jgi:hypothetical protein
MKMFNLYISLSLVLFLLLMSSCEKVINIDLKDSDPLYVIEGAVTDGESIHTIKISKSIVFSSVNTFPGVSGAIVTLSDDLGNSEVLVESTPGVYLSSTLLGLEGHTYVLDVKIDGKNFVSTSTIPSKVNLDLLFFIDDNFGGNGGKIAVPIRQDPIGIKNNYKFDMQVSRFKENKGWEKESSILIQNDDFSDGQINQQPLFGSLGAFFQNDTCKVDMFCIDKNIYQYFYSLSLNGPNGAATPANPTSNISGGCLGYFTAQTKQTLTIVVP